MSDLDALGADPRVELPSLAESAGYVRELGKPTVAQTLRDAHRAGRIAIQPRCGVGDHGAMLNLLRDLEEAADPDVLTVTIDSHTRLKRFSQARRSLEHNPADLNGYPLVAQGWRRGRQLNEAVRAPLEIRHGSPDPRILFDVSIASGITSFEGGGISYNLPYSKDVPLAESLAYWREVDRTAGDLTQTGLIVDRELFGTLTAVLVPPSISLAVSLLEAVAAASQNVRCISIAYPQGGNLAQDVAALRAIPELARRYLPPDVEVFAVLHEFMGAFPRLRRHAEELIFYGAITARLGGATKIITKTYQEALGIPDTEANIAGMRLAAIANSELLGFIAVDEDRVSDELSWILAEVEQIVEPVLEAPDLSRAITAGFSSGRLDIPFSASKHAHSAVIPRRAPDSAIRYHSIGGLPLSRALAQRNENALATESKRPMGELMADLTADINYFIRFFREEAGTDA